MLPVFVCANTSQEPGVVITQQRYNVPVLKLKKDNTVARIHVHIGAAMRNARLSEMTVNTTGTTAMKDIKQLRLYYAGADSGYRHLGSVDKLLLTGSTDRSGSKPIIKGDQSLSPGDHYFWLSVELNDDASLLHVITAYRYCIAPA
jgi:sialidase-1